VVLLRRTMADRHDAASAIRYDRPAYAFRPLRRNLRDDGLDSRRATHNEQKHPKHTQQTLRTAPHRSALAGLGVPPGLPSHCRHDRA
jgi:hypothetical protein